MSVGERGEGVGGGALEEHTPSNLVSTRNDLDLTSFMASSGPIAAFASWDMTDFPTLTSCTVPDSQPCALSLDSKRRLDYTALYDPHTPSKSVETIL